MSGENWGDDKKLGFPGVSFAFLLFRKFSCDLASVVAHGVVVSGIQTVCVRQDLPFRWVINRSVLFQQHRHGAGAVVTVAVIWPIHIEYGGTASGRKLGKG